MQLSTDRNGRVLIVDDEKSLVSLLIGFLSRSNPALEVRGTTVAQEALEALEQEAFSVVITDMHMPEMSGLELLQRVLTTYPATKTILISGYLHDRHIHEALALGVSAFLDKPLNMREFRSTVERLLQS